VKFPQAAPQSAAGIESSHNHPPSKVLIHKKSRSAQQPAPAFTGRGIRTRIRANFGCVIWPFAGPDLARQVLIGGLRPENISMRRLLSIAAFGVGFYYLWNNNDQTTELVALGAMGFALLLEFAGAD
jgi:hypothetical protein